MVKVVGSTWMGYEPCPYPFSSSYSSYLLDHPQGRSYYAERSPSFATYFSLRWKLSTSYEKVSSGSPRRRWQIPPVSVDVFRRYRSMKKDKMKGRRRMKNVNA